MSARARVQRVVAVADVLRHRALEIKAAHKPRRGLPLGRPYWRANATLLDLADRMRAMGLDEALAAIDAAIAALEASATEAPLDEDPTSRLDAHRYAGLRLAEAAADIERGATS